MRYELNTALVEDVIEFAKSGRLLMPGLPRPPDLCEISNLQDARRLAWEVTYGPEELVWTDIRERAMSIVKGDSYMADGFSDVRQSLTGIVGRLTPIVGRQLPEDHQDLLDDIVGDLCNCAFSRALYGKTAGFFERLFAAYEAGGWPCGWDGDYPSGRMAAYFRRR